MMKGRDEIRKILRTELADDGQEGLHYSERTRTAMEEARRISREPDVPAYEDMEALKRALED